MDLEVQGEGNYSTEMCSGSEEGSYLRPIYFVYHSTLGLRVIKKKRSLDLEVQGEGCLLSEVLAALGSVWGLGFRV